MKALGVEDGQDYWLIANRTFSSTMIAYSVFFLYSWLYSMKTLYRRGPLACSASSLNYYSESLGHSGKQAVSEINWFTKSAVTMRFLLGVSSAGGTEGQWSQATGSSVSL